MKKAIAVAVMLLVCTPGFAITTLVDSFAAGSYEINKSGNPASGNPTWYNYLDAGILGGARQMYARCAHNNTVQFTVDATGIGTLEWWGGLNGARHTRPIRLGD